jgi:hypothetical protein
VKARAILIPLALAGCATSPPKNIAAAGAGACRNDDLAQFVGQKVNAQLSDSLMKASGARVLRWGPPRTAMTMDFRQDRLTVSYDETMTITAARCG